MIVISVQQGISSLPPTAGQSFSYDYDPVLDTFVSSERLGPISFRSPLTVGPNRFSFRLAYSYFSLNQSFGPALYEVRLPDGNAPAGFTQFGLKASANVNLINVGGTYGIGDRAEVDLNFPITVVYASAKQSYPILRTDQNLPPGQAGVKGGQTIALLNAYLEPDGPLVIRSESFAASGKNFNDGTHAGLGRVSLGGRVLVWSPGKLRIALSPEFYFPSPNQAEFSGSDSSALLGRLIGQYDATKLFRLHCDAGYDYDFDVAQLRRFTWNAGASVALPGVTVDFGFGGSKFDAPIQWTPRVAHGDPVPDFPGGLVLRTNDDVSLGTNYVDFLGGVKVRLTDAVVLGGSVNVPVTSDGFRPDAVGTVALETYF
jgi:hypothetical protein